MLEKQELIGSKILDREISARCLPAGKSREIKAFYSEFVQACLADLKEKGIDGSDVPRAWAEISSFLWNNFTFAGADFLSEAFEKRTFHFSFDLPFGPDRIVFCKENEPLHLDLSYGELSSLKSTGSLVKTGPGVTYQMKAKGNMVEGTVAGYLMDCDTSAMFAAEIFRALLPGKEINRVDLPRHAIINIGGKDDGVYIETTVDTKKRGICIGYYDNARQVIAEYETAGNAVPFSEHSNVAAIAGRLILESKYSQAIGILDEAISEHPNFKAAHVRRADAFSYMRKYGLAIADYEKALETDPSPADIFQMNDLADAYEHAKNFQGAVRTYSRLIGMAGGNKYDFASRAAAYMKLGKYSDAFRDLSKAIECAPSDPKYYSERAKLRLFAKDHLGAVQDLSRVILLGPKEPSAFISRAEAYEAAGSYESAKNDYAQASLLYREQGWDDRANYALKKAYSCGSKAGRK